MNSPGSIRRSTPSSAVTVTSPISVAARDALQLGSMGSTAEWSQFVLDRGRKLGRICAYHTKIVDVARRVPVESVVRHKR